MASNGTQGCRPKIWGWPLGASLPKSKAPKGFLVICMGGRGRSTCDPWKGISIDEQIFSVRRCFQRPWSA